MVSGTTIRRGLAALLLCLAPISAVASDEVLLFSGYDSSGWGLWRVTPGDTPVKLRDGEMRGTVARGGRMAWATPAGRIIVASTADPAAAGAIVDGLPHPCGQPSLSSDGSVLIVACFRFANRQDDGALYRIDLPEGVVSLLYDGPGLQKSPMVSPDGTKVAFVSGFRLSAERVIEHLWVIGADGSAPRAIADLGDVNIDPDWRGDDRLIFSSDRDGLGVRLWEASLADGALAPLTDGPSDMEAAAASDGRIAYVGAPDGTFGLWLRPVSGGPAQKLAVTSEDGLEAAHDPTWTREF